MSWSFTIYFVTTLTEKQIVKLIYSVLSSAEIMRSQNMTLHLHIITGPCLHLTEKLTSFVLINFRVHNVFVLCLFTIP